jgi:heme exporter protein B
MKGFMLRELAMAWKKISDFLMDQTLIILACFVVVLAIGSEVTVLQKVGFGIVMAFFYIVTIVQAPRAMEVDQAEGFIEDLVIYDAPIYFYVMAKILVFWLFFAAPILVIFPILMAFFQVPDALTGQMFLRLMVLTLHMSIVVVFIAAVTLAIRHNPLLSLALTLPLYGPFLIGVTAQDPLIAWTLMGVSVCVALPVAVIGGHKLLLAHVKDI